MGDTPAVVFVIDDDPSMRGALQDLVDSVGLKVLAFASPQEFMASKRPDAPGCLVLDVRLPGMSGLTFQQELAKLGVELPVIFITGHGDIPMSVRAMKAGAVEFLTKPLAGDVLVRAIQQAIERSRTILDREAAMRELRLCHASLSPRERQVMELVVSGLLNKQAGSELGISEITVKAHRGQVMRKMRAESLPDLVTMAARLGVRSALRH
jgi:FixJ family two-component response regulator